MRFYCIVLSEHSVPESISNHFNNEAAASLFSDRRPNENGSIIESNTISRSGFVDIKSSIQSKDSTFGEDRRHSTEIYL